MVGNLTVSRKEPFGVTQLRFCSLNSCKTFITKEGFAYLICVGADTLK